ncbi:Superfamily I DNA/RNA helicase [Ignavibacterium album JCM 16511]|uniref:Superfamily I DNA/RNA helicase n=1 Tax=Ignavibacterium album (strain DSM 19864 / JCM 16511 / NBRC 101810 / Mat9-16) TaxID=945713 RepID=I0APJ5_IGNAJ|nr:UvrD-helicase domain-containing protein [Ignavibacterium album]AFH50902.1 Superfamily I DNA/RNA helicase [Ignavibacterium album JCM 16511]
MKLTNEQYNIINSTGDIKINAVAGSGKTTTIIEYSKSRPKKNKILYLAFNRSVKTEAEQRFGSIGLDNVKVETAHSLAYKNTVFRFNYNVKTQGYKTYEIAEILKLRRRKEKHFELIAANHINRFVNYFCNSKVKKVNELNYLDAVSDPLAFEFVKKNYEYIEKHTREFLAKMDKGEIEITHDFYLKKFQLSYPNLGFEYILFDEGQDASPAMLDVFLNQPATKVIVGDSHQQIYSWRFAINSLESVDFRRFPLTISFRFSQDIANLAVEILKWKNLIDAKEILPIKGTGGKESNKLKATLARTNLGLLSKAIDFVTEKSKPQTLYFEGNVNSYFYSEDGASLFDVLNLYNHNHDMIKDNLIKSMNDFSELEDYVEKTEDTQLAMLVEIVKKYENDLPRLIRLIRDSTVENKNDAKMIFSTVHRSKGMEYGTVFLHNDFISQKKIKRLVDKQNDVPIDVAKINEEVNILYVAITRAINNLFIPQHYLPTSFPKSASIKITGGETEERDFNNRKKLDTFRGRDIHNKSYSIDDVRKNHPDAYKAWLPEEEAKLLSMVKANISINDISRSLGRTKGAIVNRLNKIFGR